MFIEYTQYRFQRLTQARGKGKIENKLFHLFEIVTRKKVHLLQHKIMGKAYPTAAVRNMKNSLNISKLMDLL